VSSQSLVFSKTSSQADLVSPATPRAVYFGDDVSVGWVPGSPVIDVAGVDPNRGPIFYTLEQRPAEPPRFTRRADCIQCHLNRRTVNVPGLIVRSVYTRPDGTVLGEVNGFVNGHNSPLELRWGGWYVTGKQGGALHLGNIFATPPAPEQNDRTAGANLTDLRGRLDAGRYLSPHSDLVALLVLEHQIRMQNLITHANYETRLALAEAATERGQCGTAADRVPERAQQRIASAGELLLEYMLFRNEAALDGPVRGTSGFAAEFQRVGPRASGGRSLRQLELKTRLMRHPCSFLIYSKAFDALPGEIKQYLWRRLEEILSGEDHSAGYASLMPRERKEVLEILQETKPEFASWLRNRTSRKGQLTGPPLARSR
jgi:hypothetical protein